MQHEKLRVGSGGREREAKKNQCGSNDDGWCNREKGKLKKKGRKRQRILCQDIVTKLHRRYQWWKVLEGIREERTSEEESERAERRDWSLIHCCGPWGTFAVLFFSKWPLQWMHICILQFYICRTIAVDSSFEYWLKVIALLRQTPASSPIASFWNRFVQFKIAKTWPRSQVSPKCRFVQVFHWCGLGPGYLGLDLESHLEWCWYVAFGNLSWKQVKDWGKQKQNQGQQLHVQLKVS